jgi:hypothetical protein
MVSALCCYALDRSDRACPRVVDTPLRIARYCSSESTFDWSRVSIPELRAPGLQSWCRRAALLPVLSGLATAISSSDRIALPIR